MYRYQDVDIHTYVNAQQSVVYPYNGMSFSHRREQHPNTRYSVDKP